MRKYLLIALVAFGAAILPFGTRAAQAATAAETYKGQILLDVASHGEAWYVNSNSLMRVYLGRPHEALDRLVKRAVYLNFTNITRVSESVAVPGDTAYTDAIAGSVLAPDDVLGAAWYVSPAFKIRLRLATPDDAWLVMKMGVPVTAAVLNAIPVEPETEFQPSGEHAVTEVVSADTLVIDDGTKVKLIGVDIPANPELQTAAMDRLKTVIGAGPVTLESDVKNETSDGGRWRYVRAGDVLLNYDLVRNGLAFQNVEFPNWKYAELLIVGGIDAMNQKKGFWNK